ncbi:UNVERIFIED_CONTAM: hypothetical protein GTU68_036419 [Idotea baltica]|nr:hypothetical protein [Idotea baltica]
MYLAMTGGAAFIVIQLILLVFMVHKWTDKIQARVENGGSPIMWYAFLGPGLAMFLFILSGASVCLLYFYFAADEGCYKNQWFIFINAGGCFIVSFVSGVRRDPKPVGLRLLHASLISLYVMYLTWVAISSAPRRFQRYSRPSYSSSSRRGGFREHLTASFHQEYYCGPNGDEEMWSDHMIPYLSFVITFVTVVYGSIGISESEKCHELELPGCPMPPAEGDEEEPRYEREDMGGQMVIRNEKRSLVYSYSLFHCMMILACMLIMMHLTQWHTPTHATLMTFGRSWSSVWIKIISSWCCLVIYFVTVLCPSVLPSVLPNLVPMNRVHSEPVIAMNGHAFESEDECASAASEEAVPLTIIRRPTIIGSHQETTV